jgi:putative transposase
MDEYATLNHTTWDCKYHVVFIPKYRRELPFQELRKPLGEVFVSLRLRRNRRSKRGICSRTMFTCFCRSRQNTRCRT